MNGKVVLSFILGAAGGAVGMYFGMAMVNRKRGKKR